MDIEREHERWAADERDHGYVRARLRLLTSGEGGRQGAIATGYRSHWAFPPEVHHERHDAPLTLESGQWLNPGNETTIRLHPLFPDLWPTLVPRTMLTMLEGARVVGHAEVLAVVPPTAWRSAQRPQLGTIAFHYLLRESETSGRPDSP